MLETIYKNKMRLYINAAGWKMVDYGDTEMELVSVMLNFSNKYNLYSYMILKNIQGVETTIMKTENEEEFSEYLKEIRNRRNQYSDLSCVELKRDIIRGQKI